jgi:hypothetical protein
MNNKQQTSVEWLISQLQKSKDFQRVINEVNQSSTSVRNVLDQAKEMEREQLEEAELRGKEIIIIKQTEHKGGNK